MLKKLSLMLCGILVASSISVYAAQKVYVQLDGEYVMFDNALPTIKDNRTLIPLRGLFEKMGYEISWEPNTKAAILTKDKTNIAIRSNKNYIMVNNIQKTIDVPAQIINGWMMIPLRAVADATGAEVNWDTNTKTASIVTNSQKEYYINIDNYAKEYIKAIEPLSYLEDVVAQLNTLNSDGTRANIKKTQEMLTQAHDEIVSAMNKIDDLEPGSKFERHKEIALECLDTNLSIIDTLQKSLTNGAEYASVTSRINELLTKARQLNAELGTLSL